MRDLYLERAIKRCRKRKKILFVNTDYLAKRIAKENNATWGKVCGSSDRHRWFVDFSRFLGRPAESLEDEYGF